MKMPTEPTVCWAWTDPLGVRRATITFSPSAYRLGMWDSAYDLEVGGEFIGAYPANQAVAIARGLCWEIIRKEFKDISLPASLRKR